MDARVISQSSLLILFCYLLSTLLRLTYAFPSSLVISLLYYDSIFLVLVFKSLVKTQVASDLVSFVNSGP